MSQVIPHVFTLSEVYFSLAALSRQGVEVSSLSAAVSHFLCCLLVHHFTPTSVGEDTRKKSRRRGRGIGAVESTPWSTLTGAELWNLVCQEAVETYGVTDALGWGHALCLFVCLFVFKGCFNKLIFFASLTAPVLTTWWSSTACRRSLCFGSSV